MRLSASKVAEGPDLEQEFDGELPKLAVLILGRKAIDHKRSGVIERSSNPGGLIRAHSRPQGRCAHSPVQVSVNFTTPLSRYSLVRQVPDVGAEDCFA